MKHNMTPPLRVLVGLGNPGSSYAHTYHNAGFLFLDYALKTMLDSSSQWEDSSSFSYLRTSHIIFVRPKVFMNESGDAISAALRYFRVAPEYLIVAHDDTDITLGECKISFGRRSGGHRGVQSIIDALHTDQFTRFRIGVRPPTSLLGSIFPRKRAGDFVLRPIRASHTRDLQRAFSTLLSSL